MRLYQPLGIVCTVLLLAACASRPFYSSWTDPEATPLHIEGERVAAVVMMTGEGSRRAGEDLLARELTARGAVGIPLYQLLPDTPVENETLVRQALEDTDVSGMIIMRPVRTVTEVESRPSYAGPRYSRLWGGYYGYGWGASWETGTDIRSDTVTYVETLVYSLKQNKLVWGGQSRTTNASSIDRLVQDTANKVAKELEQLGLINAPTLDRQ